MREFGFELSLCARLEAERDAIVARQLGGGVRDPGGRVLDAVVVEPGPEFEARRAITPAAIPARAIESDVGPGRFRRPGEALDGHPERVASLVDRAVEIGFFERARRDGQEVVRQVARYPDRWFDSVVGIENKPDLGSPGDLEEQLRTDASLGLVDRAILATESYVTGAHLNRIPPEVGVWRFRPEDGDLEVVREPEPLPAGEPGVEPLDRRPGATEIAIVDPEEKARARRRIAERAYGKGWRTYDLPPCANARTDERHGAAGLPGCAWLDRLVDPGRECGPDCPGYEPGEPPAVDLEGERARHSPWNPDPEGRQRRQAALDRFG